MTRTEVFTWKCSKCNAKVNAEETACYKGLSPSQLRIAVFQALHPPLHSVFSWTKRLQFLVIWLNSPYRQEPGRAQVRTPVTRTPRLQPAHPAQSQTASTAPRHGRQREPPRRPVIRLYPP